VAGRLFELLDPCQCAQVTLRRPVPLEVELEAGPGAGRALELRQGDAVLVEAEPTELHLELQPPVGYETALQAAEGFPDVPRYQSRGCFVCGADREPKDGLRIRPGRVPGRTAVAAPWVPGQSLTGESDLVRQRYVWAALDCPGAYAIHLNGGPQEPLVLGRMTVKVLHALAAGERCVVAAWPLGQAGGRLLAASVLYNQTGWPVAFSTQAWAVAGDRVPGA
jgi:hypothetical protein